MSANSPRDLSAPLPDGRGLKIGVAVARFNPAITDALLQGARRALTRSGVAAGDVQIVHVPGAVELPLAALWLLEARTPVDAVVALGCVVRGDTTHYDYVCRMAADGVLRVALDKGRPVAFGVLTVEDEMQAVARAGPGDDNRGFEAALVALDMALTRATLMKEPGS